MATVMLSITIAVIREQLGWVFPAFKEGPYFEVSITSSASCLLYPLM